MTVSDASLDESGSNFAIVAATSLLLGVTRTSSEAYIELIEPAANKVLQIYGVSPCMYNAEAKEAIIYQFQITPETAAQELVIIAVSHSTRYPSHLGSFGVSAFPSSLIAP